MADNLRILVSASLNTGRSISDINKALREISKHPSLQKLKIGLEIDSKIIQTISNFNKQLSQMSRLGNEQIANANKLNGALNNETNAINKQAEAQRKLNLERTKSVTDPASGVTKTSRTYGNSVNNNKRTETTLDDGSVVGKIISTTNPAKDLADQKKMLDQAYRMNEAFNKKVAALDKSHYDALKTNKQRKEAMDKMHYMALKRNREIDFTNQQKSAKVAEQLDRAHFSALRDNRKRSEDMEKLHVVALQQNRAKDLANQTKLASLQQKAEQQVVSLKSKYGSKVDSTGLNSLLTQIKQINPASRDAVKNATQLKAQIDQLAFAAKNSNSTFSNMADTIQNAASKFAMFTVVGAGLIQSLNFFRDGIGFINELDKSLTDLSIVYMQGREEVAKYAQIFHNLGMEMSIGTDEIARGAAEFARQGLNETEMMSRMTTAVKYAKISNLDFKNSAEILTATVNSMSVDIERATDVFSYLGDATASGADEVGQAMQRVGGSAGAIGLEFEKAASWVAEISSRTRESAFTIGKYCPIVNISIEFFLIDLEALTI